MKEALIESIKKDSRKSEEEIKEYCDFHRITLQEYREYLDRALAARSKPIPKDYPKAIIIPDNPPK